MFPETMAMLKSSSNAIAVRDLVCDMSGESPPIDSYTDCADLFFSAYSSHVIEDQSLWVGMGVIRDRIKTGQLRFLIHMNDTGMIADPLTKEKSSASQLDRLLDFLAGKLRFDKSLRHSFGRALRGDGAEVHCCRCQSCTSLGEFKNDPVFDNVKLF